MIRKLENKIDEYYAKKSDEKYQKRLRIIARNNQLKKEYISSLERGEKFDEAKWRRWVRDNHKLKFGEPFSNLSIK